MKHLRVICLFFILFTTAILICFFTGFFFGKNMYQKEDTLPFTESSSLGQEETDTMRTESESHPFTEEEFVTTAAQQTTPQFCIKSKEEFVAVYVCATDILYFETSIEVSDLPSDLQEELKEGIECYDLGEVYDFLENYSS